jgi:hypothetical protein
MQFDAIAFKDGRVHFLEFKPVENALVTERQGIFENYVTAEQLGVYKLVTYRHPEKV